SAAVVGAFDPGDDLDAELVAGLPAASAVQDVLLEQGEEGLHGGVVRGGADLAHRADHPVAGQGPGDLAGTELAAPIGVKDAAVDLTAAGDGDGDRGDDEAGLHPFVDGPPDDPVRPQVLDGAEVQ